MAHGMSFSAGSQFPPGFRFHPSDQELIIHYLRNKITSSKAIFTSNIADVNIYKFNPWDLPDKAFFGEGEWFFFSPRDRKYPNGARPNRAAGCGYWKATGTDKPILSSSDGSSKCLGVKKALVFYKGRPPKGTKTDWVMNEYRLLDTNPPNSQKHKGTSMKLDEWVLCRVRHKGASSTPQSEDGGPPADSSGTTDENIIEKQQQQQQQTLVLVPEELIISRAECNMYGYGECQLFADIIGSLDNGNGNGNDDVDGGEISNGSCHNPNSNSNLGYFTDSSSSSSVLNSSMANFNGSFAAAADQMQQPHLQLLSSMPQNDVINPATTLFSLGSAMDHEFMFQTSNKRSFHFANYAADQLSSFHVHQNFPNFS